MMCEKGAENPKSQTLGEKSTTLPLILCDTPNAKHRGKKYVPARWKVVVFGTAKLTLFRCDECYRRLESELLRTRKSWVKERCNWTW